MLSGTATFGAIPHAGLSLFVFARHLLAATRCCLFIDVFRLLVGGRWLARICGLGPGHYRQGKKYCDYLVFHDCVSVGIFVSKLVSVLADSFSTEEFRQGSDTQNRAEIGVGPSRIWKREASKIRGHWGLRVGYARLAPLWPLIFALGYQIRKLRWPGTNAAQVLVSTGHANGSQRRQCSNKTHRALTARMFAHMLVLCNPLRHDSWTLSIGPADGRDQGDSAYKSQHQKPSAEVAAHNW